MSNTENKYQFPSNIPILLDGRPVEKITAFLFPHGGNDDPQRLKANEGKSFQGSIVLGMGFTFDDTNPEATPIAEMHRLIAENPKNAEVIFPYIGGEEVNSSPTHAHYRYAIDFFDRDEEECWESYPELMEIVKEKVKPDRDKQKRDALRIKWWQYAEKRPGLKRAIEGRDRVLVRSLTSKNFCFTFLNHGYVYDQTLIVFAKAEFIDLTILSSRIHEVWANFFGASMKDDPRYNIGDCFETFPFPEEPHSLATNTPHPLAPSPWDGEGEQEALPLFSSPLSPSSSSSSPLASSYSSPLATSGEGCRGGEVLLNGEGSQGSEVLEAIGRIYYEYRAQLMIRNNQGLTATYNRFHDPHEDHPDILKLRELHHQMDRAVLDAYGWQDIHTPCGFTLDYLDTEPEQLPPQAQQRITSGDLFFPTASDAIDFDILIRTHTAKRGKLPWRYKWPQNTHDEVLSRLLALNQERHEAEIRLGLQGQNRKPRQKR